ncbi:hypothetical protein [Sporosarcina obsidiansis]|uniref:hypothetical protein n=1 Tax=Sporosarcina obsidiansis TaxID=2660748 RepID=UPI00129AF355|nr:hypothetical protein [Sporosarcina obsidiansis]
MTKPKYFIEYTIRIEGNFRSVGDFSDEIHKPEHFLEDCGIMLSKVKGRKEKVVFLYEDEFEDECFLMYTFDGEDSEDSVYVKYYHFK